MKFCQDHWDKLKSEIASLGLESFVSGSEGELSAKMEQQSDGEPVAASKRSFDPLMGAFVSITGNLFALCGIELMLEMQTPPNPECPLCFLQQRHEQGCKIEGCLYTYDDWLKYAATEQLEHAKRLGLVGES